MNEKSKLYYTRLYYYSSYYSILYYTVRIEKKKQGEDNALSWRMQHLEMAKGLPLVMMTAPFSKSIGE